MFWKCGDYVLLLIEMFLIYVILLTDKKIFHKLVPNLKNKPCYQDFY